MRMRRRPSVWFATLLTVVVGALGGCAGAELKPRASDGQQPHLRVMTYNVNYGLAGDQDTLEAIAKGDCDVIFLQETTPAWESVLREAFEDTHHMAFLHSSGAGGMAVLSKTPFEADQPLMPPKGGWFPAWRVTVDSPIGPVQVLQVHLRPAISDKGSVVSGYFTTGPIRKDSIETFVESLEDDMPTLIVGDFNENEGGAAVSFLRERGLVSVLPQFAPEADTWRWTTSVGQVHSRLDHIVYDPALVPLNAEVLQAGRSDHLPVIAVFEKR